MRVRADFVRVAARVGTSLVAAITARDGLSLRPATLSRAAARRLRTGLRALEAYLRRLLLCMALHIEPDLKAQTARAGGEYRPKWPKTLGFRVLDTQAAWPGPWLATDSQPPTPPPSGQVPSAALLLRLDALAALLQAPEARAGRLAWHLARRADFVAIPDFGRKLGVRYATEAGVLFVAMARAIQLASGARPPPLGPAPRPPPRLRVLECRGD